MEKEVKYSNGTYYNFISVIGEKLGTSLAAVNDIVFGVIDAKPYQLEWKEIIAAYHEYKKIHGKIDIDDFSFNYVVSYSFIHKVGHNQAVKEAMYLDVRTELLAKKAIGEL